MPFRNFSFGAVFVIVPPAESRLNNGQLKILSTFITDQEAIFPKDLSEIAKILFQSVNIQYKTTISCHYLKKNPFCLANNSQHIL